VEAVLAKSENFAASCRFRSALSVIRARRTPSRITQPERVHAHVALSPPDYGRRGHDRISGPMLFPVAVDPIALNDDFAWSAFANETAFLDPTDLDGSTPVARIVVV
jgi:hypothetical protein